MARNRRPAAKAKRKPETIWKLIDVQCSQLSDAVAAARVPFLLSLLWAFIWAWTLYSAQYGYIGTFYRSRLDVSLSLLEAGKISAGEVAQRVRIDCRRVTAGKSEKLGKEKGWFKDLSDELTNDEAKFCSSPIKERREWAEKTFLESTSMSFPGGFQKIQQSDLGVIGQLGLILVLVWLFYALRRENHAIRAFVDVNEHTRKTGQRFPVSYILEPQERFFSAEHLAYAYHAVSQRFLFIFSKYHRPLLGTTVLLVAVPAAVATLHVLSDVRDVRDYNWAPPLSIRLLVEGVLLVLVWFVTIKIIALVVESSLLLNGWYLASKNVWIDEWDENTDEPASAVRVKMLEQTTEIVRKKSNQRT